MKKNIAISLLTLAASALIAADVAPKDEITAAAKKLGEQPNYTWKATVAVPEDAQFKPGPTDGKINKDGLTWITMEMMDNKPQAVVKKDKGAIEQEGAWKTLEDIDKEEGFARFPAMMVRNVKAPAKEVADLAAATKELKKEGEVISGDLTEEGAKSMQAMRGFGGGEGPTITGAKGSVKFWLKDGSLTKYEFKLKGNINFGGNEMANDRTTTVEIKDVGTTKLDIPEAALKKIQ
jgi:hypothetical protein